MPVRHSLVRGSQVVVRDSLAFVANGMNGNDSAALHEKPNDSRVQFSHMAQLKQPVAQRF